MEVEDSPQTSQTPTYVSQEPTATPSDVSQEPTQSTGCSAATHPGPPANSINTKTYFLVVPAMDNSSTTLQPHVLSNTVDDASSIVSDSLECGYGSDTYLLCQPLHGERWPVNVAELQGTSAGAQASSSLPEDTSLVPQMVNVWAFAQSIQERQGMCGMDYHFGSGN
ncbi:Hypothetical predicted protein [Drosophila guanche]|uniref:Uncharacterized protein n=1 Tax=Drosophila guanche TaxID=7266 RepID=A0A3B0KZN8_DROGU|nr:Hypothetical predicted protein [Drosophila guanche]